MQKRCYQNSNSTHNTVKKIRNRKFLQGHTTENLWLSPISKHSYFIKAVTYLLWLSLIAWYLDLPDVGPSLYELRTLSGLPRLAINEPWLVNLWRWLLQRLPIWLVINIMLISHIFKSVISLNAWPTLYNSSTSISKHFIYSGYTLNKCFVV